MEDTRRALPQGWVFGGHSNNQATKTTRQRQTDNEVTIYISSKPLVNDTRGFCCSIYFLIIFKSKALTGPTMFCFCFFYLLLFYLF